MTEIRNTTADMNAPDSADRALLLALGMATGSVDGFIEGQERAGQRQLVSSQMLPTRTLHSTREQFEAVGVVFGEPDPADPMFQPATLPAGWSKRGSDHDMWSYVVDEHGRERIAVFYKAAWYDRSAHMSLTTLTGYVSGVVRRGEPIITDETWATREAVRQSLAELADSARASVASWTEIRDRPGQRESSIQSANEYIPEYTAEAEKYEALAAEYAPTEAP